MNQEELQMHDLNQRMENSKVSIVKAIFPGTTNHYDTLFGGTAMLWMDEVAFISATRFSKKRVVTVSTDRIDFKHPIPAGTIVELIAKVTKVGRSSLTVNVQLYLEKMYEEYRKLALEGNFSFVAIDQNKQTCAII